VTQVKFITLLYRFGGGKEVIMNDCPKCSQIKRRALALWDKVKRPTLHQTIHYEARILPDAHSQVNGAPTLQLKGSHACPVWRLLLVTLLVLTAAAITFGCREDD
jgi:hypothetical protein